MSSKWTLPSKSVPAFSSPSLETALYEKFEASLLLLCFLSLYLKADLAVSACKSFIMFIDDLFLADDLLWLDFLEFLLRLLF